MPKSLLSANPVSLVASAAKVATGNSGALTNFPGIANSYSFILDCTAASGTTPTLDLAIQHSVDGGTTWYVWQRFTQMTSTGTRNLVAQPGMAFGEAAVEGSIGSTTGVVKQNAPLVSGKVRVLWTIGGTNPSFTFAVYCIANPVSQSVS